MKNKLFFAIGSFIALGVVGVVIVMNMDWGTVESELKKTDVTFEGISEEPLAILDLGYLESGQYKAITSEGDNLELLFKVEGLKKTTGKFNEFEVFLNVKGDSSALEVKIQANSIFTNNKMRDESLISDEFFDVNNFPEINFKSSRISKSDTSMVAVGILSLLGQTNGLSVPFDILGEGVSENGDSVYIVEGQFEFDRTKYGMLPEKGIGDIVSVSFYCEFDML
jgi:polyisoprenoid-binding protein YceI